MVLQIHRPDIVITLPEYNPPPRLVQTQATARVPRVEEDESRRQHDRTGPTRTQRKGQQAYQTIQHPAAEPALLASQIMTPRPLTLAADVDIDAARRMFRQHDFRHIPLTGPDGRIAGIVSERDLLRATAEPARRLQSVADVATHEVLTATADTGIREIAATMLDRRVGCVPIIDGDGRPLGIITRADILRALVRHAPLELWI